MRLLLQRVLLLLIGGLSLQQSTAQNLLQNPSCETGGLAPWTVSAGAWMCSLWFAPPPDGASVFRPTAFPSSIYQDVDVSSFETEIDEESQAFAFSGYVNFIDPPSGTTVETKVEFLDAASTSLGESTTGPIPVDFSADWIAMGGGDIAPVGTRTIRFWVILNGAHVSFDAFELALTDEPLPVELITFVAHTAGRAAVLNWETASETNNAGFEILRTSEVVEMQHDASHWQSVAFVNGHGTTVEPQRYSYGVDDLDVGTYWFRLKQVDFDGSSAYSPKVEVAVEVTERFVLEEAYPNPFNPQATARFAVREAVPVHVALYDALGRRVQVLYDGVPPAGEMQAVQIDGSRLPSGAYVVRLMGEGIAATQRVVLVK